MVQVTYSGIIGIIGAMEEEIRLLKENMVNLTEDAYSGFTVFRGQLAGQEVALVQSGIGKVNATLSLACLVEHYLIRFIINTGTAAGVGEGIRVGDLILAQSLVHHDVDLTAFGYAKGQMSGMPPVFSPDQEALKALEATCQELDYTYHFGLVGSGDQFIASPQQVAKIKADFPEILGLEMESAAIAQAAHVYGIPFIIIRCASDSGDDDANFSFDEFVVQAGAQSARLLMAYLARME